MSNITSVKASTVKPSRWFGVLLLIVGIGLCVNVPAIGIPLIVVSVVYLLLQKTVHHVMLATAGGESSALQTNQREYLEKVVAALNDAIVHRG